MITAKVLLSACALLQAAVEGPRCEILEYPQWVEEGAVFLVTVEYAIPEGSAKVRAELKNTRHFVIGSDIVERTGTGRHTFRLTAPDLATEAEVLVACWMGDDWREPLGRIGHTGPIRIISRREASRRMALRESVESELARLKYAPSPAGNIALLDFGGDGQSEVARKLSGALGDVGLTVTVLDAEAAANPFLVTPAHFDLLVVANAQRVPEPAVHSIAEYARAGGKLVVLGGPAFRDILYPLGDRWLTAGEIRGELARLARPRNVLFDFDAEPIAEWRRESNSEAVSSITAAPDGGGNCAHIAIRDLTGWDSFASPELPVSPPAEHLLTCFRVKGDGSTTQIAVEWRERDGSRWIAVAPVTTEWTDIALTPTDFAYWHDSPSTGRGHSGDRFRPENAVSLVLGLAFTHTHAVGGGDHDLWVDDIATAPLPEGFDEAALAPKGADLPSIEGISPSYKTYLITEAEQLVTDPRQALWSSEGLAVPPGCRAAHPRPQGTGFDKNRRWRWIPLLNAVRADGKTAGAVAVLVLSGSAPYEHGIWLSVPTSDPDFLASDPIVGLVADIVPRMLDGVFLYEGGSQYYAYEDGEEITLGAELVSFGRGSGECELWVTVTPAEGGDPLFSRIYELSVSPGGRQRVSETWAPGTLPGTDYRVTMSLIADGEEIDRLEHPLTIWRPNVQPAFMTAEKGDFVLGGRKWYAHGVNYMPSSGIGIEDMEYFEHWLDPRPYDPDIIEEDLADIADIGFNMVSVFIYYRSLESHNLWDLLTRCERHGLKVNLSLRPGTPMDFRWNEMRALIERHRLAECDTVFAYDLAWEPVFGWYQSRCAWDAEWEGWIRARYGDLRAAETAWGFSVPRRDGSVTGPSDQQLSGDGPWRRMVADYRRFVDDLIHEKYSRARELVRSVDPNHLVSFRMSMAGDPTCSPAIFPYDFRGLRNAVDIMEPEAYGRIGDWESVKPGWFTVAYSRCVAPDLPVMWAEFGCSTWDMTTMATAPDRLRFAEQFYRDFYEMALRSGSNGTVCWWFPGGFRWGENSDYGILNPDRSWRGVTRVINEYARRMTEEREVPAPDTLIPVSRDAHPEGIYGIYAEVKDAFWAAVEQGLTPGLQWVDKE